MAIRETLKDLFDLFLTGRGFEPRDWLDTADYAVPVAAIRSDIRYFIADRMLAARLSVMPPMGEFKAEKESPPCP